MWSEARRPSFRPQPGESKPSPSNPPVKTCFPTTYSRPAKSYTETTACRSEARSSTSPILSHNEVAYYIGFVLIEEEEE